MNERKIESDWIPTAQKLPEDRVVVSTMDGGGHVQKLKRIGRLWFFPDGSMYVYYVPGFWKPIETA